MTDCLNDMIEALLAVDVQQLPCLLVDAWFGELCFLLGHLRRSDSRAEWHARIAAKYGLGYPGGPEALRAYVVQRAAFEEHTWQTMLKNVYAAPVETEAKGRA